MDESSSRLTRSDWYIPAAFAVLKLLLHLPVLHRFGYHHDELYFLACGHHLAFGYVDHAPLVPWIARMADTLFGQSLVGLRLFPLLAGAGAILLAGLLVRKMEGGKFAQAVTCVAMLTAPVYLRTSNMLCIPAFEPLIWLASYYLIVRIVQEDNPKLWLWVGLIAGIGLMTKHSMLFFGFGLAIGLLLTPHRKYFLSPWLYAGGAIAVLVFLPNLIWQATHDWATVEFIRGLNEGTMSGISVLQFAVGQLLYLNPLSAPLWMAGLGFLFFTTAGSPYRILGWMYIAIFVLLVALKSKIYYLAPAYPPLFAAGAMAVERLSQRTNRGWLQPATAGLVLVGGAVLAPLSVPVLTLESTERYVTALTFGAFKNVYELTGDLRGMFGWKERVAAIAEVYDGLPEEEKSETVIFSGSYGLAGAVDYFGGEYGLPKASSGHMTYYLWGLPDQPIDTVIVSHIGQDAYNRLKELFDTVEVVKELKIYPFDGERDAPFQVLLCRGLREDFRRFWPQTREW